MLLNAEVCPTGPRSRGLRVRLGMREKSPQSWPRPTCSVVVPLPWVPAFSSFSCSLWFTACLPTITFQFQEPLFYFFATSTQILMIRCFAHIPKSLGWLRWRHRCPGVGTWVPYIDFQINEIIVPISISQSQNSHRLYVEAIYPEAQSINL